MNTSSKNLSADARRRITEAKAIILSVDFRELGGAEAHDEFMRVTKLLRLNVADQNDGLDIDEIAVSDALLQQADPELTAAGYKANRHLMAFDTASEKLKETVQYMQQAAKMCEAEDSAQTLENFMAELGAKIEDVNEWVAKAGLPGVSEKFCQVSRVHPQFVQSLAKLSMLINETNGSQTLRLA
ncbi:MAG: hypothetical protein GC136_04415 [Alphaproteobacteria bacterium]|nr:hypothetical protein [Alphaproteobacteria bacterium]